MRPRWLLLVGLLGICGSAFGEPWIAVREGLTCSSCHVNRTGGGLRTPFGNAYAQRQLPARALGDAASEWTGVFGDRFGFGANLRTSARQTELDDRDDNLDFGVDRATLYLGAELSDRISAYVDQQVAPGGSLNREAWAQIDFGSAYVKAGRLFLPFGWRIEDDTAFVRSITGVNMTQGDDGVEFGINGSGYSVQAAVTNGNGGGPEVDDGKLFTGRAALVRSRWRLGVSTLHNDRDDGQRTMAGIFAGVRTGPVSWLAEVDHIDDDGFNGDREEQVGLLEANLLVRNGHNLKLTAEARWFDDGREDQYRFSGVYEYFPWAFAQLRLGIRARESDNAEAAANSELGFIQMHVFF